MSRRLGGLGLAALGLTPELAWACAVCVDSARGSQGFGWPYAMLMVAPFVVAAALAVAIGLGRREPPRGDRPDTSR